MGLITTDNYDIANAQNVKEPVLVLQIEGLPYVFASNQVFTTLRYDDSGVNYDGTYDYDGLRTLAKNKIKTYIDRKGSSSTISQKLEQWDGKASVETMNITLVDVNGEVTKLLSPGYVLDEIINKKVKVYFGYTTVSYPQDYVKIFTGYINDVQISQGKVQLLFTDPSSKRKQVLFNASTTVLTADMLGGTTTVNVVSTSQLYQPILDGAGNSDSGVTVGLHIGDEIITYNQANVTSNQITNVTRGAYGTAVQDHAINDQVECFIRLQDNPVTMALKLQLSGWNGPFVTGLPIRGIINADDGLTIADTITFPVGVDVVRDHGVVLGDYVVLSGFTGSNNGTFTIREFLNDNKTVVLNPPGLLTQENPPTNGNLAGSVAFRSKYDTYPKTAGLGLTPDDVFVERHEYLRDTFVQVGFDMKVIGSESSGKEFLEKNILKVIGGYALTQGSRISMGLTHPPLSNDLTKQVSHANVINPKNIVVRRGLNTRFFYNEVVFQYAHDPIKNEFKKSLRIIDADAQHRMHQVSVLAVDCKGLADSPATVTYLTQRAARILLRHRFSAETIELQTIFGTGHTVDGGDTVVLTDNELNPVLKIANTETGGKTVINRVMEVQERSIDLTAGTTKMVLLSNLGFSFSDRYAVIGPSSQIESGFSTTRFKIKDSYYTKFPGAEYKKWKEYQGLKVKIHNADFTQVGTSAFTLDTSDPNIIILGTALSFVPSTDMIMTMADYDETSSSSQSAFKNAYAYLDAVSTIASGSSSTVFTLSAGAGAKYLTSGQIVYVQSPDGSRNSPDVKIISRIADQVTVGPIFPGSSASDLGFTPLAGDFLNLAGFKDGGAGYRLL